MEQILPLNRTERTFSAGLQKFLADRLALLCPFSASKFLQDFFVLGLDTYLQVCYYYTEFGTIVVIPRKILYRVSRRKADGTRGSALKTRYNKLGRNTPKPLPAKAGRDKTRYNIQSWFHGKIDREPILFMLNRCNIWTVAWFTWEIAPLIIIPSFVPMELLQQSMIVLEFYLLYRVFAIETLVVQGIHFKTRYNFFLGITAFVPNSAQC